MTRRAETTRREASTIEDVASEVILREGHHHLLAAPSPVPCPSPIEHALPSLQQLPATPNHQNVPSQPSTILRQHPSAPPPSVLSAASHPTTSSTQTHPLTTIPVLKSTLHCTNAPLSARTHPL
ncbi:hypothetical protein M405DRAFT_831609, partial [Rhizopogon salebrosus TDB-379]